MNTQSFNQILDNKIQNHWKNTLKMPVLAIDELLNESVWFDVAYYAAQDVRK